MSLERKARAYVAAVEGGAVGEDLAAFYHPDVIQHELPNRLIPAGAKRELADILEGAERGSKLMERQIYDIHTVTEVGDRVILEYTWTGYPRTPVGGIRAGEAMRPDQSASATTVTIQKVRCAGTAKPAISV